MKLLRRGRLVHFAEGWGRRAMLQNLPPHFGTRRNATRVVLTSCPVLVGLVSYDASLHAACESWSLLVALMLESGSDGDGDTQEEDKR